MEQEKRFKTNTKALNDVITINNGDLIIVGSRPGMGKTTMLVNTVNKIAEQINDKILFFDLEGLRDDLKSTINCDNVELANAESIDDIITKSKEVKYSMIVIDYLQLIPYQNQRLDSIAYLNNLKLLAVELQVPIIVTSQLNRIERDDKRPILSDFAFFNSMEQEVDKIICLYSDKYYKYDTTYTMEDIELIVLKN